MAGLEQRAEAEARRLAALADAQSEAVARADLDGMAAELAARLARLDDAMVPAPTAAEDDLAAFRLETRAELREGLDDFATQLAAAAALAGAVDAESTAGVTARLDRIEEEVARLAASVEARGAELKATMGQGVDELRHDVEARMEALAGQTADFKGNRAWRGARKQQPVLGPADLDRLADTIEGWRVEGNEEVDALRAELTALSRPTASGEAIQAAVTAAEARFADRLDEMAAWVVAEATKAAEQIVERSTPAGPGGNDLPALKERVEALAAALVELQRKTTASLRKPPPQPAATPPPTKRRGTKVLAPKDSSARPPVPGK
jgi:hypothetical protein